MNCVAIIPARGGSKRIPRKNIKNFIGKPIIAYSIEAALNSGIFDEVMVSTDDDEIARVAKEYGASVPFFRSPETSNDTAITADVLIEVLSEYTKRGNDYEYLCCIYPCAPFITADRLQEGMKKLLVEDTDSVFPVVKFSYPPQRCLVIRSGKTKMLYPKNYSVRSQDFEPLFHDAGQFYITRSKALIAEKTMFCKHSSSIILRDNEVQDIDTEEDWQIAEMKFRLVYG